MRTSERGMALIRHFEGFSSTPYRCPGGYITIGYGHLVRSGDVFHSAITQKEAEKLLSRDMAAVEHSIHKLLTVTLLSHQWDAVASFVFNLGAGAFERSALRRKINRNELFDASKEFKKWVWAGGRKLPGLIKRRSLESALFAGQA